MSFSYMASSSARAARFVSSSTAVPLLVAVGAAAVVAPSPSRPLLLAVPKERLVELRADTALLMFTLLWGLVGWLVWWVRTG